MVIGFTFHILWLLLVEDGGWFPRLEEAVVCDEAVSFALLVFSRGRWQEDACGDNRLVQSMQVRGVAKRC